MAVDEEPEHSCPNCNGLAPLPPRRRRVAGFLGVREVLLVGAAIGLMLGVSWVDERYACAHIDEHPGDVAERDAALDAFGHERCAELDCASVEVVSRKGCLAKIRVEAPRVDAYGDELGTFVTVEGLDYSPMFGRWSVREVLDDKQILGLPVPD
jgi:hypothetical protein